MRANDFEPWLSLLFDDLLVAVAFFERIFRANRLAHSCLTYICPKYMYIFATNMKMAIETLMLLDMEMGLELGWDLFF